MELFKAFMYPHIIECKFGETQIRFLPENLYYREYLKQDIINCLFEDKRTKNIELEARHELAEDATRMWVATAIDEDFDLLYDMTQILKLSDLR